MHGNPPLHLTLALIGFMLLAIPLAKLTFARTSVHSVPSTVVTPKIDEVSTNALLRVRFAHLPKRLSILYGAETLVTLKGDAAASPVDQTVKLSLPKDGVEFIINAEWPEGTPATALTIDLEPDGLETRSATRWSSDNRINDTVSFTW